MIKKNDHKKAWIALMIAVAVLVLVGALDNLPHVPSMLLTVLQKGAIYALVAVSMGVWLMKSDGGTFALLGTYPDEAAEGFGARLPVIAGTFALTA